MARGKKNNLILYLFWGAIALLVILFILLMVWKYQTPPTPTITDGTKCKPLTEDTYCGNYTLNWCVKFPGKRRLGNIRPTFLYFEDDEKGVKWKSGQYYKKLGEPENGKTIVYFWKDITPKSSDIEITLQMVTSKKIKSKKSTPLTLKRDCLTPPKPIFIYDSYNPGTSVYYFCPNSPPILRWKCNFPNIPFCYSEKGENIFELTILDDNGDGYKNNYLNLSPDENGIYSYEIGSDDDLTQGNYNVTLYSVCGSFPNRIKSLPAETKLNPYNNNDMTIKGTPRVGDPFHGTYYKRGEYIMIYWDINPLLHNKDYYTDIGTYFLIYSTPDYDDNDISDVLPINYSSGSSFNSPYQLPETNGHWNVYISVMDGCSKNTQGIKIGTFITL